MKRIFILVLVVGGLAAKSQVKVSGRVSDIKNKPLAGASITLKNSYDGATTDSSGTYTFSTTEKGGQTLEISIIGFKPTEEKLNLTGSNVVVNITLKEMITEMKAVVISAGSFEASDKNKGAVLNPLDIVTTPSANGDVTSAFKTLPGTQQIGESEGLFVRGGTATESKIFQMQDSQRPGAKVLGGGIPSVARTRFAFCDLKFVRHRECSASSHSTQSLL